MLAILPAAIGLLSIAMGEKMANLNTKDIATVLERLFDLYRSYATEAEAPSFHDFVMEYMKNRTIW